MDVNVHPNVMACDMSDISIDYFFNIWLNIYDSGSWNLQQMSIFREVSKRFRQHAIDRRYPTCWEIFDLLRIADARDKPTNFEIQTYKITRYTDNIAYSISNFYKHANAGLSTDQSINYRPL